MKTRIAIALILLSLGLVVGLVFMMKLNRHLDVPIPPNPASSDSFAEGSNGMVVSVSGPATDVGVAILKAGGNAVDAAVATAFALTAAYPPAGNISGGGFMLVHPAPGQGEPTAFDYRESAPAAATPTMFAKGESQYAQKAAAVPGTIRGMALAHQRFGLLPWQQLIAPAIALARDGTIIDKNLAETLNQTLAEAVTGKAEFEELKRVYGKPGNGLWVMGDRLIQPDLAKTLQLLADRGPDAFYTGPIATEFLAEMKRGGGVITAKDLADYRAIERKPLTTRYHGWDVYVPPPPSSGGVCLIEELNVLESFDIKSWGRWSPKTVHVMAEAMRRANYDRARFLGDPAFAPLPTHLLTREYGRQLAETIDLNEATPSISLAKEIPILPEGKDTTHFSVIDKSGMAVANTYTLERRWGSRIVVKNMGFLLNNDMFAFNHYPGETDTKGSIGTSPNTIAPGKRPLTSQTPTIVSRAGKVKLITGSPGSRTIPHTVLCIMVNLFDFDLGIREAVAMPRFSHQWFPDQILLEYSERYPELCKSLSEMGHKVIRFGPLPQGDAHTIWVREPNHYQGAADDRISGKASGY